MSYGYAISSLLGKTRNRRKACEKLVNGKIKKNEKIEQGKQRPALNMFTHTTLLCCVGDALGNPQKTSILGPRRMSSGYRKARFCIWSIYRSSLFYRYFNSLDSRLAFPHRNTQEG
jgi:hypothetical protein